MGAGIASILALIVAWSDSSCRCLRASLLPQLGTRGQLCLYASAWYVMYTPQPGQVVRWRRTSRDGISFFAISSCAGGVSQSVEVIKLFVVGKVMGIT